jgi:hypothetical protein
MAVRAGRRPAVTPRIWTIFLEWWGLGRAEGEAWWQAMGASEHYQCRRVRHALLFFDARPVGDAAVVRHLMYHVCAPAVMIEVLEALVAEGRIARPEAARIEDGLLRATDREGAWYGARPRAHP